LQDIQPVNIHIQNQLNSPPQVENLQPNLEESVALKQFQVLTTRVEKRKSKKETFTPNFFSGNSCGGNRRIH
jgi:hypothetical protein